MGKFKTGDRVKVVNKEAKRTGAKVRVGRIGRVVSVEKFMHKFPNVTMDTDKAGLAWSIPEEGLELVKPKRSNNHVSNQRRPEAY